MSQIINVTSEQLQATIRRLLPSQQGFGEDLQASNVILPIIDLTATAEGSSVGENLQTAFSLDSQTSQNVFNQTATLVATTGFYRTFGVVSQVNDSGTSGVADLSLSDGLSTKFIFKVEGLGFGATSTNSFIPFDFVIFLEPGHSLTGTANGRASINITTRQIADVNGNLINPAGFSPQ